MAVGLSAANVVTTELNMDTGKGAVLQGQYPLQAMSRDIMSAVSQGDASHKTLKTYGIDMDKTGMMSFDATTFAAAYAADPVATKSAIYGAFAKSLAATASSAIEPVKGSVTQGISGATDQSTRLNKQIDDWTSRLTDIQARYEAKFSAMNTMLAKLQGQSTYLTSMLKSLNGSSSSSSS